MVYSSQVGQCNWSRSATSTIDFENQFDEQYEFCSVARYTRNGHEYMR